MLRASLCLAGVAAVMGDVYMQNPRGSNDRCNEGNQDRNNANRLFDSQNNAAGGYGVAPRMRFYESSYLTVEWTAQHACGNDNTHCQFVLQYMCGKKDDSDMMQMRDGTTTDRIPDNDEAHEREDGGAFTYGMHETQEYYRECNRRERNKGLFIADRDLNGDTAIYTRQNNNGNRHGFECEEEREYYPYRHPSPWKDVAVFTTDTTMCSWYRDESQNTKNKGHCTSEDPEDTEAMEAAHEFNNLEACEAGDGVWVEDMAWEMDAPECLKAPWSRDNHLGNGITDTLAGHMVHYNWSLPSTSDEECVAEDNCICVLRLRYNISTGDYEGRSMYPDYVDSSGNVDEDAEEEDKEDAVIFQDPYVTAANKIFSLALNTNQYGRTFQDRSHTFEIRPRPDYLSGGSRIFNLNVRGKRGNIVQTYPALEYDFTPTNLVVRHFDHIHFQWTGFDDNANNGNNNAEGTEGTDRSNIVQIANLNSNMPVPDSEMALDEAGVDPLFSEVSDRHKMAFLDQDGCSSLAELRTANNDNDNDVDEDEKNCMKLNRASPSFDGGLVRMNRTGTFFYQSTRNNNFSNRSQKGSITVLPVLKEWAIAVTVVGAILCLASIGVGALTIHAKANPMSRAAQYVDRF